MLRLQRKKSLTIYDSSAIEPRQIELSPKFIDLYKLGNHIKMN